jgi:hypothetical protein
MPRAEVGPAEVAACGAVRTAAMAPPPGGGGPPVGGVDGGGQ